jgi:NAD(P)-dependent dehydrogenase (short-subunit alcohol dehydrogenase family)
MKSWEHRALVLGAAGLAAWWLGRPKRTRQYDFAGKSVLITGGSRGLGLVLGRQLTEQGAQLAICARDEEELHRAADDLAGHGFRPAIYPCDISDASAVRQMVEEIESRFGRIDVLINNASIISVGPVSMMTREDFEQALAINFWGTYNTVEAALPGMRRRQEGRIVNISSIGGKVAVPHLLPYDVAKFAVVGYSQGLRAELSNNGVFVTTICPGLMRTGSPRHALFKGRNEAEYTWFSIGDSIPLLTLSAEEAAREIIEACRNGQAEAVLSLPAQAAVILNALLPELTADVLALMNSLLPRPGGIGSQTAEGKDSQSFFAPSWLTALTERAARRNNEIAPAEQGS